MLQQMQRVLSWGCRKVSSSERMRRILQLLGMDQREQEIQGFREQVVRQNVLKENSCRQSEVTAALTETSIIQQTRLAYELKTVVRNGQQVTLL